MAFGRNQNKKLFNEVSSTLSILTLPDVFKLKFPTTASASVTACKFIFEVRPSSLFAELPARMSMSPVACMRTSFLGRTTSSTVSVTLSAVLNGDVTNEPVWIAVGVAIGAAMGWRKPKNEKKNLDCFIALYKPKDRHPDNLRGGGVDKGVY